MSQSNLRAIYDSLPDDKKSEVMDAMHRAIKWRGWLGVHNKTHAMAAKYIQDIADVFTSHTGKEFEEYT